MEKSHQVIEQIILMRMYATVTRYSDTIIFEIYRIYNGSK